MNILPIILSIAAGICLCTGLSHLLIGLSRRPRDWTQVTFALTSLVIFGTMLAVLALHTAESVGEYTLIVKYGFAPAILTWIILMIWFAASYTGVKPRRFLLVMSLWFLAIMVLQFALPTDLLLTTRSEGFRPITQPWAWQLVIHQFLSLPAALVFYLYLLTMFGFIFYAVICQYRSGDQKRALALGLVTALILVAAVLVGLLDAGILLLVYVTEFAFFGIVIIMSSVYILEDSQKEAELLRYQDRLRAVVEAQTEQLAQEIAERQRTANVLQARLGLIEFASTHSLDELFQATLDEAEALTDSTFGYFHFLEDDQETLWLQQWSTNTRKNMCTAEGKHLRYTPDQAGVWVDCIRRRQPVIHNDYEALSHRKGLPDGHAPVLRELVVPVFREERIVAILGVGNKAQDYDEKDVETISLLADLAWNIAERKRAEEALQTAQERYEMATQAAKVGVWDWNRQTGEFYLDPNLKMLLGYTDEEIPNDIEVWRHFIHPDDREPAVEAARAHIEGQTPEYVYEHRMRHKDGSTRWILVRGRTIRDERGDVIRLVGTDTDITERKRVEEALRESDERLRSTMASMDDLVFVLDDKGIFFDYYQPEKADQLYLPPEAFLGKPFPEVLPPHLAALLGEAIDTVIDTRRVTQVEYPMETKGDERWYSARLSARRDGADQVSGITIVARDITERKQAEAALLESEEKFRNLAEHSPNMIFINRKGRVVYANRRCEEAMGYTREEFYSPEFDFFSLIAPQYVDLVKENYQNRMQGESLSSYEYGLVTKAGQQLDAILTSKLIQFEGASAILGVITDITERKQAEGALSQHIEQLAVLNQIAKMVATMPDLSEAVGRISQAVAALLDARFVCVVLSSAGEDEMMFLHGFDRETGILEPSPLDPALADSALYRWVFSQPRRESLAVSAPDWQSELLADFPLFRQVLRQAGPQAAPATDRIPRSSPRLGGDSDAPETGLGAEEVAPATGKLSQLLPTVEQKVLASGSLQSLMVIPLVVRDATIGFLSVATDRASRSYTADDVSLAETIGSDIVTAIESARLLKRTQAVAAAEERSHLARELHDSVTQTLYSIAAIAEALPGVWERQPDLGRQGLRDLGRLASSSLAEMRTLVLELRPAAIVEEPMDELLRQLVDAAMARAQIPINLTLTGECSIPPGVRLALYRIAQEGLNNAIKYAQASQIRLGLYCQTDRATLGIGDNGRGFDSEQIAPGHFGLSIMRERAEAIGAELILETEPESGTEITVIWIDPEGDSDARTG